MVTFPKARYLFGRVEWERWKDDDGTTDDADIAEAVRPVVAAGAADFVETDHRLCDEVHLVPTPGHTPGHVSVVIESRGERAVITGDVAHHPLQYGEPDLRMYADDDSARAATTRRAFLAERTADGGTRDRHALRRTDGRTRPGRGRDLALRRRHRRQQRTRHPCGTSKPTLSTKPISTG